MPRISLALSEIIQRRLFRAREHLQGLDPSVSRESVKIIADASYEITRGLRLPAVRHDLGEHRTNVFLDDAVINLTTVLDYELIQIELEVGTAEEVVTAAQELMTAVQQLPLRASPQATG